MHSPNLDNPTSASPALSGAHLDSIYAAHLHEKPDACALIDPQGVTMTYAVLEQRVQAATRWLADRGVTRGDRVAVWLINQPEWLVLFFALARLGATLVAVNTRFRSHELQYILSRSQACMLIMQPGFRKLDFPAIVAGVDPDELPDLRVVVVLASENDATDIHGEPSTRILNRPVLAYAPDAARAATETSATAAKLAGANPSPTLTANAFDTPVFTHAAPGAGSEQSRSAQVPSDARADLPVVLFTTSGTTKGPKLVIHTQRTISGHSHNVKRAFGMGQPGDTLLAALPFCGVFGLNSVLGALAAGQPIVMLDVFNADDAIEALLTHGCTHLFATDEMLRRIAECWPDGKRASLRLVGFAAFSPGAEDLAQIMADKGFPLAGVYGSSEVMALFSYQLPDLPVSERTLGGGTPASPDAIVRIRNPETGALCAPDEAGEIEIASPTNFVGYLNNPEATAQAIMPDGFFRTGDLGYLRRDGSFVYLSRMGDAMRLGGFLVNPTEIEYAITLFEGVQDAQVVAVEMQGRLRPVAFVLADDRAPGAQAMIDSLTQTLAPFKVPARIWVVDEFPTTASANGLKFQRVKLRDMAMLRLADETA